MMFTSHGRQYQVDSLGVIHQTDAKPFIYDKNYISTYDSPAYVRGNEILQALRLGFVIAAHGRVPTSLLDIGYGNGAFLKAAGRLPIRLYGKDVTGEPVEGVTIVDNYFPSDVYTFHDCFEHIADLSFIENVPCETLVISLPWCHIVSQGQAWFDYKYKHRKPDEHLHHFNKNSLERMMYKYEWIKVAHSNHEDIVRTSEHGLENILTMAFKRP